MDEKPTIFGYMATCMEINLSAKTKENLRTEHANILGRLLARIAQFSLGGRETNCWKCAKGSTGYWEAS